METQLDIKDVLKKYLYLTYLIYETWVNQTEPKIHTF